MALTVSAIKVKRKENPFDLFDTISDAIKNSGFSIKEGDVLVISSKFISNAQGRLLALDSVRPSAQSLLISKKYRLKPEFAEVVIRESDKILGGISGFVISSADNILAPNAGIDKSNAKEGKIILYPYDPYLLAEQLRRKFFLNFLIHVALLSDKVHKDKE